MKHTRADEPARPAATVVLLRDGPDGCEVLLIRRHGGSGFMPGATVFPGGKVEPEDARATALGSMGPFADVDAQRAHAYGVAAVRELHEEAHVLLALDGQGRAPHADAVRQFDSAIEARRSGRRLAAADWHACLAEFGWTVDLRGLACFAHWLTPQVEPRRFDTLFFAATLPSGQEAALDVHETTDLRWMSPAAALADHAAGGPTLLPPPTAHTLDRLAHLARVGLHGAEAVRERLDAEGPTPRLQPHFDPSSADGPAIALPWDPLAPGAAAFVAEHGPHLRRMTGVADLQGEAARRDRYVLHSGRFCRVSG